MGDGPPAGIFPDPKTGETVALSVAWAEGADRTVPLPAYRSAGAAGADLCANFGAGGGTVTLAPGARALVPTGLRMAASPGFEVQIRARSGLALHHGIGLANGVGTVDSDYRGPVGVILMNHGAAPFTVTHGMRVAQMVLAPVVRADITTVETLDATARGAGGFGSTGVETGDAGGRNPEGRDPEGRNTEGRNSEGRGTENGVADPAGRSGSDQITGGPGMGDGGTVDVGIDDVGPGGRRG